eukprot:1202599-Pleurochrysis_carterae.AAC.1
MRLLASRHTGQTVARASVASRSPSTTWRRPADAGNARCSRGCATGALRSANLTLACSQPRRYQRGPAA